MYVSRYTQNRNRNVSRGIAAKEYSVASYHLRQCTHELERAPVGADPLGIRSLTSASTAQNFDSCERRVRISEMDGHAARRRAPCQNHSSNPYPGRALSQLHDTDSRSWPDPGTVVRQGFA